MQAAPTTSNHSDVSMAIASPASPASAEREERRPFHGGRARQAAGDEPLRSDPDIVGTAHPVAVVVGVVHPDLEGQADDQGADHSPPHDVAGPDCTRRRRARPERWPLATCGGGLR